MGVSMESWSPPAGWRAEFERQATPDVIKRATRYARKRVKLIARVGKKIDPLHARELVQDALGDTLDGTLTWEPARISLEGHVVMSIRSRTRHEVVRATRLLHRSLDDSADDNSTDGRPLEAEATYAITAEASTSLDLAEAHARRAVDALRRASGNDRLIGRMLDAYEQGKTERFEVLEYTGMSANTYNNVRRRLIRLAEKLPEEIREIAQQVLA